MPTTIHPTAIVEKGAVVGADCTIHAYAIVTRYAVLGDCVTVFPFAVVGGDPQMLKFDLNLATFAEIGSGTMLRESVTINRSTQSGKATVVGKNCLLMANSHVAHDCHLGDSVVAANNVMIAGHAMVGDFVTLGGGLGVHQYVRIGESAVVAGLSRVTRDIGPFTMAGATTSGLNLVGLKRRGFSREAIIELKQCYRAVYLGKENHRKASAQLARRRWRWKKSRSHRSTRLSLMGAVGI